MTQANARLEGGADFSVEFLQEHTRDRFILSVDGRDTGTVLGSPDPALEAPAGLPKSIHLEAVHHHDRQNVSQPLVRLTLGESALTLQSDLDLPMHGLDRLKRLIDTAGGISWRMVFNTADIGQLRRDVPALVRRADWVARRGGSGWRRFLSRAMTGRSCA